MEATMMVAQTEGIVEDSPTHKTSNGAVSLPAPEDVFVLPLGLVYSLSILHPA